MNIIGVYEELTDEEIGMVGLLCGLEAGLVPFIDIDTAVHQLKIRLDRLMKAPTITALRRQQTEHEKVCALLRKLERYKLKAT
jgi:hypothetical protein